MIDEEQSKQSWKKWLEEDGQILDEKWEFASPRDAVDYLDLEIKRHDYEAAFYLHHNGRTLDQSDATVTLPLDCARLVLDCALKGMRKGSGRGNVALSRRERDARSGLIHWARRRKVKLIAQGKSANESERLAAEWASRDDGVRLSVNTIIRMMRSRD